MGSGPAPTLPVLRARGIAQRVACATGTTSKRRWPEARCVAPESPAERRGGPRPPALFRCATSGACGRAGGPRRVLNAARWQPTVVAAAVAAAAAAAAGTETGPIPSVPHRHPPQPPLGCPHAC
eukprot:1161673-Alexandrium_andersonii.AAC.1